MLSKRLLTVPSASRLSWTSRLAPHCTSLMAQASSPLAGGSHAVRELTGKRRATEEASAGASIALKRRAAEERLHGRGDIVCRSQAAEACTSGRRHVAPATPSPKQQQDGLWLVVGLGNPGSAYERSRHNVGFMVVDELARLEGIACRRAEKSACVGRGEIGGRQVLLVKPMTFMNNSGDSVGALAKFYKVPPSRIIVVSDDLDQPTAGIKLKPKGGHGGHNGLRSIMERMGDTQEFPRLKIGIGRPAGDLPPASYVLQDFSKKEREAIDVAIQESVDIVRSIFSLGLEKAVSGARV